MEFLSPLNYERIKYAVLRTGHLLRRNFRSDDLSLFEYIQENYGGHRSLRIDLLAEDEFVRTLNHGKIGGIVLSEENGVIKLASHAPNERVSLILDPLDGSWNYKKQIPISVISVGIHQEQDHFSFQDLTQGVMYDFHTQTMYEVTANNIIINERNFTRSLLQNGSSKAFSLYTRKSTMYRRFLNFDFRVMIRSLGSAALELMYVATNSFDAFIDIRNRLKPYDFAVGARAVKSMGGHVIFFNNKNIVKYDELDMTDISQGYTVIAAKQKDLFLLILHDLKEAGIINAYSDDEYLQWS